MEKTCNTCKFSVHKNRTLIGCGCGPYIRTCINPSSCGKWEQAQSAKETEPAKKQYKAGDTFHDMDGDLCIYLGKGKYNNFYLAGQISTADETDVILYTCENTDNEWMACLYNGEWLILPFDEADI